MCIADDGFKLRIKDNTYFMNNASLLKELKKTLDIPLGCNSFIIGSPSEVDGVNYWPLLLNK